MRKREMRRCQIFECDRLGGRYCCADCDFWTCCKDRCLNDPSRCKLEDTAEKWKRHV